MCTQRETENRKRRTGGKRGRNFTAKTDAYRLPPPISHARCADCAGLNENSAIVLTARFNSACVLYGAARGGNFLQRDAHLTRGCMQRKKRNVRQTRGLGSEWHLDRHECVICMSGVMQRTIYRYVQFHGNHRQSKSEGDRRSIEPQTALIN